MSASASTPATPDSGASTARNPNPQPTQKVGFLRILTIGGSIMAFLIGSGFATGQEILQYFAGYGLWGVFGTGLTVLVLISFVSIEFLRAGQEEGLEKPSDIFRYYGGKILGTFYDWFSILFVFLSFTVMVAGAGAVFESYYNLPPWVGGMLLALAVIVTVWFGLDSLVDVIGRIGPLIVVVAIGLGFVGIANNPGGIIEGHAMVESLDITTVGGNWFMASLSYVGFSMLWLAAFLTALGKNTTTKREVTGGGLFGGAIFSLACIIVALGLLANIEQVHDASIPMLELASNLGSWVAILISIMILAGIYTTAIPLLWTVSSRIFTDGSMKFKLLTIVLAIAGAITGLFLPFEQMVNLVYGINGYVGAIFLGLMIIHTIIRISRGRKATGTKAPTSA